MKDGRYQILLTNDDGIMSPGLHAAARELGKLGYVTIAAPLRQYSGAGRSLPADFDRTVEKTELKIGDQCWPAYAVGGPPAMVVLRVLYEILDFRPDLVVSGINYGENVGDSITASGTVGAALEAATWGIPAIAVSRQIENLWDYLEHSENVDFSTAAYFTAYFARQLLQKKLPYDVDVLKIDVPIDATPQTPWRITRMARNRYYAEPGDKYKHTGGRLPITPADVPPDSDIAALLFDRVVSVTPLSVDLTSRVDFETLRQLLSQ